MRRALVVLVLLAQVAWAAEEVFTVEWSQHVSKGIHRIDCVDVNGDGEVEVYAVGYDPVRTMVYAYSLDGKPLYSTLVPREAVAEFGDEDTMMATVADLDGNRYLDIVSATEIKVSSINNHRLYRHQRTPEEGLERLYNRYVWMVKDTGLVTSISFADVNNDSAEDIVTSAIDNMIRVYNYDGELLLNVTLPGSVWDSTPVSADNDSGVEYLAAAFKGLYLLDDNGSVIWTQPAETRFDKSASSDLDGDGAPEFIGLSGDKVLAFDTDGKPLWSYEKSNIRAVDSISFQGLEDNMENQLLVAADTKVVSLDSEGNHAWDLDVGDRVLSLKSSGYGDSTRLIVGTENSILSYRIGDYFKKSKAFSYYTKALDFYNEREFNLSAYYSGRAAELYRMLGLPENETMAMGLETKARSLREAERLYLTAEEHFNSARYNQSIDYVRQALEIYGKLNYEEGINKSTVLERESVLKAEEYAKIASDRGNADEYYAIAEAYYVNSSYAESLRYARLALEWYGKVNYGPGIQLTETLISMNQMIVGEGTTTTTLYLTTTTTLQKRELKTEDLIFYGSLFLIAVIAVTVTGYTIRQGKPTS